MKFDKIAKIVKGVPYTSVNRGKILYDHIISTKAQNCIELGFAHGVATCYIAAALHELGSGMVTSVDLESSIDLNPKIETLLSRADLESFVSIHREVNSYNWFLKKEIEKNSEDYHCKPTYDFCFIDGPKNWTIDGFAFFLIEKLLVDGGYVLFDDYLWRCSEHSKDFIDGISTRNMSPDQVAIPNIEMVFQLLVMQHPNFGEFVIDGNWAWAKKCRQDQKKLTIIHGTKQYSIPLSQVVPEGQNVRAGIIA